MTELWTLSASALASLVRAKKASARDVALDALARLDAVNPRVNAIVEHRPDEVLKAADDVDRKIARGDDPGPLAGVPVTTKINVDQAGYATTNGLRLQRDLIAKANNPVVDNLIKAGAVVLGRSNAPAFALRWFTTNQLHGDTHNPRDRSLTPGGSSGGAAVAIATGIGALAHGTDIGGSIRYPAYANGVHGLRPSLGRVPAFNASSPERGIGPQLMAVSGPIGRTIADLRLALHAMAAPDPRDPWCTPMPLEGPAVALRAALCLRPSGLKIAPEIETALHDAARRLADRGWTVEEIADVPSLDEASELQASLWLGDGFAGFADMVEREGDPAALAIIKAFRPKAATYAPDVVARTLVRRATIVRDWQGLLAKYAVLLLPVSGELPFPDGLDLQGEAGLRRVGAAQMTQTGLPLIGVPCLAVATGLVGTVPVGVQIVAARYREDLCLAAGEAIEAGGVPPAPIDPV